MRPEASPRLGRKAEGRRVSARHAPRAAQGPARPPAARSTLTGDGPPGPGAAPALSAAPRFRGVASRARGGGPPAGRLPSSVWRRCRRGFERDRQSFRSAGNNFPKFCSFASSVSFITLSGFERDRERFPPPTFPWRLGIRNFFYRQLEPEVEWPPGGYSQFFYREPPTCGASRGGRPLGRCACRSSAGRCFRCEGAHKLRRSPQN